MIHQKPIQVTVYRLTFDKNNKTFKLWDNIRAEETTFLNINFDNISAYYFPPEAAIQRVSWCPNECAGAWLASGGSAGLVRLDCTERG